MNNENPNKILTLDELDKVVKSLKDGCIAAIPTDTVYGIAARYSDKKAIERIYRIKNRPKNKPLIVFIKDSREVEDLVDELAPFAIRLMDAFWPGALTLIFRANESVPKEITAGLETVGIRVPECKVVLDILKKLKEPLVVTSANRSGEKEVCSAEEVMKEIGGEIDCILDGGTTKHKCVSTIVDVSEDHAVLKRAGSIKKKQLEEVAGFVEYL